MGVPIVNPVAKFLFANPSLYPLPNATPVRRYREQQPAGPQRSFKANNQGDIKIEYDPRNRTRSLASTPCRRRTMGKSRAGDWFPGANIYPTKVTGVNWVHTFSPSTREFGAYRLYAHGLEAGLPDRLDGTVRDPRQRQGRHPFPNQAFDGFSLPGHQRRHQRRGQRRLSTAASSTTPTATSTT